MSRDGNSKHPRTVFGRRKGHKLTVRHAGLMQTLLPQLALDLSIRPTDLSSLFPCPVEDVWLEIGFGGGEHMIDQSRAHPRVGILGVEPFVNGMAKALAAIDAHALTNIRLHHGDAMVLLDWLPRACLGRVDLLYPVSRPTLQITPIGRSSTCCGPGILNGPPRARTIGGSHGPALQAHAMRARPNGKVACLIT